MEKNSNNVITSVNLDYQDKLQMEDWLKEFTIKPWDKAHFGAHPKTDLHRIIGNMLRCNRKWHEVHRVFDALRKKQELRVVILENLPIGKIDCETPRNYEHSFRKNNISEALIVGLADLLDTYIRLEKEEVPFNEVIDGIHEITPDPVARPGRGGSVYGLSAHTDRCFVPENDRVEFCGLLCLREQKDEKGVEKNPKTGFITLPSFIEKIPRAIYYSMFEKEYKDPLSGTIVSLLHGEPEDHPNVTATLDLNKGWFEPTTKRAGETLDWLYQNEKLLIEGAYEIELKEGAAVIFNHLGVLHYRTQGVASSNPFLQQMGAAVAYAIALIIFTKLELARHA